MPGELALTVVPAQARTWKAPATSDAVVRHNDETGMRLRNLLSYADTSHQFNAAETETLIAAIEQLKILDPACGSGAFPMGMLQKLVRVL